MADYIPRRFTCWQVVSHPNSNRAQCQLTTLIEANALTTALHCHWLLLFVCNYITVVVMHMTAIYKIVSRRLVSDKADGDSSVPSYNSQKVTLPSSSTVTDKGTKTTCCWNKWSSASGLNNNIAWTSLVIQRCWWLVMKITYYVMWSQM